MSVILYISGEVCLTNGKVVIEAAYGWRYHELYAITIESLAEARQYVLVPISNTRSRISLGKVIRRPLWTNISSFKFVSSVTALFRRRVHLPKLRL